MNIHPLSMNWIDDRLAAGSLAVTSARSYRNHLGYLVDEVGDMDVTELTTDHLRQWVRSMAELAPATRYVRLSAVASFLDWCVEEGLIPTNPADRVARAKLKRGRPRPVPVDLARKVVAGTPDVRTRLMVLLAVEMGLRRAEIASTRVSNIDWDEGVLIVRGKGDKERTVPLTNGVRTTLATYLTQARITSGWLFPSSKRPGQHLEENWVGKVITKAGIRATGHRGVTAHRYRHRAGTDIARSAGIYTAQHLLGHASVSTTQVYAEHDLDQVRAALIGRDFSA